VYPLYVLSYTPGAKVRHKAAGNIHQNTIRLVGAAVRRCPDPGVLSRANCQDGGRIHRVLPDAYILGLVCCGQ